MNIKYLSYLAAAALVLSTTSCDDFLDKAPDERVTLKTPDQLRLAMVNAYSVANIATLCELSGDNLIDNNSPDENGMRYNLEYHDRADLEAFSFDDVKSNMEQDSPSYIWANHYHAIAVCNNVIEGCEKLEAEGRGEEVSAIKGEALVSRAFHHFVLANMFSMPYAGPELSKSIPSIPYMTEIEDKVLVKYERENLASVYSKVRDDIEAGIPLLNDGIYDVPKYHFNVKAANAFAARFFLYCREYELAEKYATEALGGASANPAQMMRTFWSKSFTSSSAYITAYCSAQEQSNLMLIQTMSWYNRARGGRFAINRTPRSATIYGNGPTWNTSYTHYYCHPCYAGKVYLRGSQEYGIFILKAGEQFEYKNKVQGTGWGHVVRCEFTAEEALLTRAEARIWLSQKNPAKLQEALADLSIWDKSRQNTPIQVVYPELTDKAIRDFYTVDPEGFEVVKPLHIDEVYPLADYTVDATIAPYLQCVLHFRRLETIDDGLRWFDIKRYGIEITHHIGASRIETLTYNDGRRALQIPPEVITAGFAPNVRVTPPAQPDQLVANKYLVAK